MVLKAFVSLKINVVHLLGGQTFVGGNPFPWNNRSFWISDGSKRENCIASHSLSGKKINLYSHLAYANAEHGSDFLDQQTVASLYPLSITPI